MKKSTVILIAAFVFLASAITVWAAGEKHGGDIIFPDTKSMAHVIFSHQKHLDSGNQCGDCHDQIFQKKKGSSDVDNALTMKSMKKGMFCSVCHDGKKAFKVMSKCGKCHVK